MQFNVTPILRPRFQSLSLSMQQTCTNYLEGKRSYSGLGSWELTSKILYPASLSRSLFSRSWSFIPNFYFQILHHEFTIIFQRLPSHEQLSFLTPYSPFESRINRKHVNNFKKPRFTNTSSYAISLLSVSQ